MELDMTKGKPSELIVKFIIPIILGNIFQQMYNVADTVIVGQFVGVQALAAVGATGTISFLILGFMQGLTTGFTVLTSQRYGAGDTEGLKRSVGNAWILSIIVTVVMTVLSAACMDWLLQVMQTPEDIYEMARTYILIICLGMGFNILYNLLASMLRAVGNSRVPLYFLVLAAVLTWPPSPPRGSAAFCAWSISGKRFPCCAWAGNICGRRNGASATRYPSGFPWLCSFPSLRWAPSWCRRR